MRLLAAGLALTVVVTVVLWGVWGPRAVVPAACFGLLATGIQLVAARVMRGAASRSVADWMMRWALGMGLRLGGVAAFAVVVALDRDVFVPLPTALGYVGVLIPLLFLELRFLR